MVTKKVVKEKVSEPEVNTKVKKTRATKAKPSITSVPPVQVNDADLMWNELRSLPIQMYALPNQMVEDHLIRVVGVPNELYLKTKSSAALPALEELIRSLTMLRVERTAEGDPITISYPKYEMKETDMYIVITRFVPPKERPELQPV